jgi:hypothetical protein
VGRVARVTVFAGTSACFRRFRPGIPVAPAAFLDQAAPTDRSWRLLDVGTGPGLVDHALLSYFDDLIAVDVEPAMLTEAEALLRPALDTAHRLQLRHALAEDFLPREGQPHLVTCKRVFYWLDKPASSTVRVTARSALRDRRIRQRWEPPTFRSSPLRFFPFAASGRSPRLSAICTRHRSRPQHLFGDCRSAFEAAVTDALACFTDGGVLSEDNAFTAHTARHPSAHENG